MLHSEDENGAAISDFDDMAGYSFRAVVSDIYGSSVAQDEMPTKEQIWYCNPG